MRNKQDLSVDNPAFNRRIPEVSLDPLLQGATTAAEGPGPTAAAETQRHMASASLCAAYALHSCLFAGLFGISGVSNPLTQKHTKVKQHGIYSGVTIYTITSSSGLAIMCYILLFVTIRDSRLQFLTCSFACFSFALRLSLLLRLILLPSRPSRPALAL